MKKSLLLLLFTLIIVSCKPQNDNQLRTDKIISEINNPNSKNVLVVVHRGDWRNHPENSLAAIQSAIDMKADVVEVDLKLTKDSILVLCHDQTIDRTTNGTGKVGDFTLDSLKSFKLKFADGTISDQTIPTLEEALLVAKDQIVVNLDHAYWLYDQALAVTEKLGVTNQILMKGASSKSVVEEKLAQYENNFMYMPIVNICTEPGKELFDSYISDENQPVAYEVCWPKMDDSVKQSMAQIIEKGSKLWVNTLWPSLNGGLCDEAAKDNPELIYGQIVELGATMVQTDRPALLIEYLRTQGLHE